MVQEQTDVNVNELPKAKYNYTYGENRFGFLWGGKGYFTHQTIKTLKNNYTAKMCTSVAVTKI